MTIPQIEDYAVRKLDRGWGLLCGGTVVKSPYGDYPIYFPRKRDALEAIPYRVARQEYEARTLREDGSTIVWTEEETRQISAYADHLRTNAIRLTLNGYRTAQEIARHDYNGDFQTLKSWSWSLHDSVAYKFGEHLVCAEVRRRRAATRAAFRLAGLPELPTDWWVVNCYGRNGTEVAYAHDCHSKEDAEAYVATETERLKAYPNETYRLVIEQKPSLDYPEAR